MLEEKFMKRIVIVIIIISLFFLLSFYLYYENNKLQVSNYEIINKRIPSEFNNYKIVQISDFHNTKSKILTNDLIKKIKNIKPNLIVLTGDLIDSKKLFIDVSINFIKKIKDIAPIYYVYGNHEAKITNYKELENELRKNNVIILDNKTEVLNINDAFINIIGVSDPSFSANTYIDDSTIIKDELKGIEYDYHNYTILLSHRPELFDTYVSENIDLILTGHAHGGQIIIPFIGGLIAPNQGLFPKYTSGVFNKGDTTMIVSRGIGNSILPFRINNRPELVVINLHN